MSPLFKIYQIKDPSLLWSEVLFFNEVLFETDINWTDMSYPYFTMIMIDVSCCNEFNHAWTFPSYNFHHSKLFFFKDKWHSVVTLPSSFFKVLVIDEALTTTVILYEIVCWSMNWSLDGWKICSPMINRCKYNN